jgi:ribosomal protein S26
LLRGKEALVTCDNCGRKTPRSKAVADERSIRFGAEQKEEGARYMSRRKVYYCISCAKHKGIFERKKAQAARFGNRY